MVNWIKAKLKDWVHEIAREEIGDAMSRGILNRESTFQVRIYNDKGEPAWKAYNYRSSERAYVVTRSQPIVFSNALVYGHRQPAPGFVEAYQEVPLLDILKQLGLYDLRYIQPECKPAHIESVRRKK